MPVRQLSEAVVNRIAAGEVVERPASVVKELIENALDAGARRIDVLTDGGGRRLIRIADDGGGMTRADLALAVERHATSKLDDDDLNAIRTLGFRGEALPSIGAVARLAITTRHRSRVYPTSVLQEGSKSATADFDSRVYPTSVLQEGSKSATADFDCGEPHAWTIAVDGGAKSDIRPAALGPGTCVEVRDLFYATPARLKFLKTDRTEAEAIRDIVRRLAMSRPDVGFTLAGDARAAYADHLPRDRHPVVALFVTLDPREVDVNVHPAKTEVRFRDAGLVRAMIVRALQDALARHSGRTASTGGAATIAAFRANAPRWKGWDWRRSPARPAISATALAGAPAGFAQPAQAAFDGAAPAAFDRGPQAAFDVGAPAADARILEAEPDNIDRPLGAAR